ncbi:membrane protein [Staphylococcus aureus]|nr:membrane protein [Staphylococcus aureus]
MSKKHVFIIIGVILCICIVATVIHFKMKYDEKEKQKQFIIKNNKRVLHFISSITLKNRIRSNLYTSQSWKQVLWEVQ